ncbi:MAG: RagB/SusD family nutrient uptake outer membrane protein [Gemmatimonadales bacterium]
MKRTNWLLTVAALVSGACDFDIIDPNNPSPLGPNPSRADVAAAAAGILIAARQDAADWILDASILGREGYRFDGSDPRFITEFLNGPLDPGSGAFGGDHWLEHYAATRSTNDLLNVIGTASALSVAEQAATSGFAKTMQAYAFLMVLSAHAQDSIPVDVNRAVTADPAPFVTNDSALGFASGLLDDAQADLGAGGAAFPFSLPAGFAGFNTPVNFLRFNRALKVRVEVYRGSLGCGDPCYTAALTALGGSFVDTSATADLAAGVYFNYSTNPGDQANPLFQNPLTGENVVHPSLADSLEAGDTRLAAKTVTRTPTSAGVPPLTSNRGWTRYPATNASIAIIRNEELILLRAEANNALTARDAVAAANDINYIRVKSGGLAANGGLSGLSVSQVLDELLVQRKYSLLYEGHRWVDMRRTGRLSQILIDRVGDVVFGTLAVPNDEVLARQP